MKAKKNPNIRISRWSNVFFLLGLAIMLLISWRALEWKSYQHKDLVQGIQDLGEDLEMDIPITQQNILPPPPPPPPAASLPEVITVVEDNDEIEETVFESSETDQNKDIAAVEISAIEEFEEEEEIPDVPFAVIEEVPIYPGCSTLKGNSAKKKCMEEGIMTFVQKKFNVELANELGLEGRQRISVQFKIDKYGNVVHVRARAPHPRLEEEAIRLVRSLPKMTPGRQRDKPVGVLYALPIIFQVETSN